MSADTPTSFVCPKDVDHSANPSDSPDDSQPTFDVSHYPTTTPPPTKSETPKKKRKSWGQVLPEPTTKLPPRKRAKTEDEKAQRKYERVQRNRQAAHNSRMRKQGEMDLLQIENHKLKDVCQQQENMIAQLQQQLAQFRRGSSAFTDTTEGSDATPSLISGSPSTSSLDDFDDISTPPDTTPNLADNTLPLDTKQLDDSHSAVEVESAWYQNGAHEQLCNSNDLGVGMMFGKDMSMNFTLDDFIDTEGLPESSSGIVPMMNGHDGPLFTAPSLSFDTMDTLNDLRAFAAMPFNQGNDDHLSF